MHSLRSLVFDYMISVERQWDVFNGIKEEKKRSEADSPFFVDFNRKRRHVNNAIQRLSCFNATGHLDCSIRTESELRMSMKASEVLFDMLTENLQRPIMRIPEEILRIIEEKMLPVDLMNMRYALNRSNSSISMDATGHFRWLSESFFHMDRMRSFLIKLPFSINAFDNPIGQATSIPCIEFFKADRTVMMARREGSNVEISVLEYGRQDLCYTELYRFNYPGLSFPKVWTAILIPFYGSDTMRLSVIRKKKERRTRFKLRLACDGVRSYRIDIFMRVIMPSTMSYSFSILGFASGRALYGESEDIFSVRLRVNVPLYLYQINFQRNTAVDKRIENFWEDILNLYDGSVSRLQLSGVSISEVD